MLLLNTIARTTGGVGSGSNRQPDVGGYPPTAGAFSKRLANHAECSSGLEPNEEAATREFWSPGPMWPHRGGRSSVRPRPAYSGEQK